MDREPNCDSARSIHFIPFGPNGYSELAFLCNGTDRHKIRIKNVNRCPLLNFNGRIFLKIFSSRGAFAPKVPFLGRFHWPLSHRSRVTFFDLAKPSG